MDDNRTIGLDIGGTHISAVLINDKLKLLKKVQINTPRSKKVFASTIINLTRKLDSRCNRVGIAVAGIVHNTRLSFAPNIKYSKNTDFKNIFPKKFAIAVDNDARSFLRGETSQKNSAKKTKILAITIGTGIGRALAINGKIVNNKKFEYPEKWEPEYQAVREKSSTLKLTQYLANKLSVIILKYQPTLIILGGGVVLGRKSKFLSPFKKELINFRINSKIKTSKLGAYSGALGAAINLNHK
jgi:predicted NBD/HSP70 family sugar kinase